MIKRIVLVGGGLAVVSLLLFGRDTASYVCTSASRAKEAVRGNIPLEFEIDRARKMVKDLIPDIRRNMHVIAKEEVEIERIQSQITASEAKLTAQRGQVIKLRTDLTQDRGTYSYAGRQYTNAQVKADLANRFERYKTDQATLDSLRDLCVARQKSLEAAHQKLEGMLAAKRKLEVDVENLEVRLKMVEVAQTTSDFNFDDSQLARVKDLIGDLRGRLAVAEKLVNADRQCQGEISLEESMRHDDIAQEVADYFQLGEPGAHVAHWDEP